MKRRGIVPRLRHLSFSVGCGSSATPIYIECRHPRLSSFSVGCGSAATPIYLIISTERRRKAERAAPLSMPFCRRARSIN